MDIFFTFCRVKETGEIYSYSGIDCLPPSDTTHIIGSISVSGPKKIRQLEGCLDEKQYIQFLSDISPEDGVATFVTDNNPVYRSAALKTWLSSQSALKRFPWPSQLDFVFPFTDVWRQLIGELNHRSVMNPDQQSALLWGDVMESFEFLSANSFFENAICVIPWRFIHLLNKTEYNC